MKKRSKQETSDDAFLSIVILLSEPQTLSERNLGEAVESAYGHPEKLSSSDGSLHAIKPGFAYFLKIGPHLLQILNTFNPYVDDPVGDAATIPELRRRKAFAEHRAWMSVDYLRGPYKAAASKAYGLLGKLSAELLSEDYLGLYFPDANEIVPAAPNVAQKLRAFVSLDDLHDASVTVVPVEQDDPRLAEVVAEAHARWPEFLEAFSRGRADDLFVVKSRFADENSQEWMWSTVEKIEADTLMGRLSNRPNAVKHVPEGDEVVVQAEGIGDWFYANEIEQVGQFSIRLLQP
jgi:uncharacterized protein YegJ (DUF2314 family)